METIPEILFREFCAGVLHEGQRSFHYPERWASLKHHGEHAHLVLTLYGDDEAALEVRSSHLKDDGSYPEHVFARRLVEVVERWADGGEWSYGSGSRQVKTVKASLGTLGGIQLSDWVGEVVVSILSRAHELSKEHKDLGEERWVGSKTEAPR